MRVTGSTFYKDYAKTVQDLKSEYNKSMDQVSSGKKYSSASESPLDYYAGKKIDNLYNDAVVKDTMIKDVVNRLEQQETASRTFYSEMSDLNVKYSQMASSSYQGLESTVDTMHTYFVNAQQTMTQDLNATYENYYVMGGNDATTIPFAMSDDGMTLTYYHKFAGDDDATVMSMTYDPENKEYTYSGTYYTKDDDGKVVTNTVSTDGATTDEQNAIVKQIVTAMREQGRMSLGYGDITNTSTLPDTYYGGLNMVTGLTSDALRAECDATDLTANIETFKSAMNTSAFALNSQAIYATGNYYDSFATTGTVTEYTTDFDVPLSNFGFESGDELKIENTDGTYISYTVGDDPSDSSLEYVMTLLGSNNDNVSIELDKSTGQVIISAASAACNGSFTLSDTLIDNLDLTYTAGTSTTPEYYTSKVLVDVEYTTYTGELSKEQIEANKAAACDTMNDDLSYVIGKWDHAMIDVSNTFRRIGVTTSTLENVQSRLQTAQDNYEKEYNDHLGIDTYDAIVKMYQGQFAYNAAMQVGSKIMQNSLFDFVQ